MNPIDTIKGKIIKYDERRQVLIIEAPYDNIDRLTKRQYERVEITLIDSRPLSDKQRKMSYALLHEIADWQGQDLEDTKEERKLDFAINELENNGETLLSFAKSPMSIVAAFQRYLVRFVIKHNIPTKLPLYEYADDINDYVYQCLINKKCAVCGKLTELHHIDKVGMGRNREEIIHEGMECISLCGGIKGHHGEAHTMGHNAFMELYHFDKGVILDKTLCKIYGLKTSREKGI